MRIRTILAFSLLTLVAKSSAESRAFGQTADNPSLAEEGSDAAEDDPDAGTEESGALAPPVADAQASVVDAYMTDLQLANLPQKVDAFYDANAIYDDPTGHYEGREAVVAHLKGFFGGLSTLSLEVKEEFVSGDETVAIWTATVAQPRLSGGQQFTVDGVSHVRVKDGKAIYQHDYYDLAAAVYERVPVVSWFVHWVKGKMLD